MTAETNLTSKQIDPKGLIRESYRIEGITLGECRSIFLDWAMSGSTQHDTRQMIEALLAQYGTQNPTHPMSEVLKEGLAPSPNPKRRGGRSARVKET